MQMEQLAAQVESLRRDTGELSVLAEARHQRMGSAWAGRIPAG
jgi:hypothetical protein